MSEAVDATEGTPVPNGIHTPPNELQAPVASGTITPLKSPGPERNDDNAYIQIIESLRSQNNELFTQVTALNAKLVQSYDRVSDLEDTEHDTQATLRTANLRVAQLEMERMEHLSALDTGLLVEKEHVTAELSRLMEKVGEEAAQRGLAETAKHEIEKDLDDLSATLFNQANTMVAEARFARAQSEKKAAACEVAMKSAEEAVAVMQSQMQSMSQAREAAEAEAARLKDLTSKADYFERKRTTSLLSSTSQPHSASRLLNNSLPYEEFVLFIGHLRGIRPLHLQAPVFSSLVSLPFLTRLNSEDSDPTLRLDLAPSLNWLTRRSITAAVQQGQLRIEPMQSSQATVEFAAHLSPSQPADICCALCGKAVMPFVDQMPAPPSHPLTAGKAALQNPAAAWASTSRFFRTSLSSVGSGSLSRSSTANSTPVPASPSTPSHLIYIFRLSLPAPQRSQPYALCPSGWCLARMRATCEMWRFIRTNVVEKVWEEESATFAATRAKSAALDHSTSVISASTPRPISRRTSSTRVGSLWEKGWGALGVDVNGSNSNIGVMGRSKTDPSPLSPKSDISMTGPSENKAPSPPVPPRRVAPPPLPGRNAARPGMTASPTKGPTELPAEEDSFATPRTSLDDRPLPAAVSLNDDNTTHPEATANAVEASRTSLDNPPGTPRSTHLPLSGPSTPSAKPDTLPAVANSAVNGAPAAPPPVPRRAAARRAPLLPPRAGSPSPRTSVVANESETVPSEKRSSTAQLVGAAALAELDPDTPSQSKPSAPLEDSKEERTSLPLPNAEEVPVEDATPRSSDQPASDDDPAQISSIPPPVPPRDVKSPIGAPKNERLPSAVDSITSDYGEDNISVGEKTWEDKAWRELSRLRLEMFWSRIGASSSQRET